MDSRKTVDVSVVVANYNNAPWLDAFFDSILHSTVLPKELIVVDDGSTDDSLNVIEPWLAHDFIRLIRLERNQGFAHALNAGIRAATGRYIARMDPDDLMMPDRLEKQSDFLAAHPDMDVVGGNVTYFHAETGKDITKSNFPLSHQRILATYRAGDHGVQHPTVLARAELFRKYAYDQEMVPAEDYDIFARMISDGCRFANLPEPVNRMRIHPGSVSQGISYETIDKTFTLRDHIFHCKSGPWSRKRYFGYIANYRRFLITGNPCARYFHLLMALFWYPEKALRRLWAGKITGFGKSVVITVVGMCIIRVSIHISLFISINPSLHYA